MSFFIFNQLYGQWHVMSRGDSCLNAKVKTQSQSINGDSITDRKDKDVKEKDPERALETTDQLLEQIPPPSLTLTLKNEEREMPDIVEHQQTDLENPTEYTDIQSEVDAEPEENLKEIEYLHLPSQSIQKLEERIKYSPTARRKFRLWKETMGMCVYCGKHINALDYVTGVNSDIEHIQPQALGGKSTFDNLVCSCRKCNRDKGDMTAMDYVLTLNSRQQSHYLSRLRLLVSSGAMSQEKYFNLLRPVMLLNVDKN